MSSRTKGGALRVMDSAYVSIVNTSFENIYSQSEAGAIHIAEKGAVVLFYCNFSSNFAKIGGAVDFRMSILRIE